ncbi:MAG: hypothetical protein JNM20_14080 [Rhizobiales bacterium]|nr:hypothetical protein [Hyphomicrobiales bacterium]
MAAGTGRIALKQIDGSMAENARQIEMPEAPVKKEAAPPRPARPEPPKLRSQWPTKPPALSEAPRPANRFDGPPPPPAPYILTPDKRHIDAYWRSRHQAMGSVHDDQAGSLRRVSNPAFDADYRRNDYRDHDDYDDIYQDDEPDAVPARQTRRSLSRHGRTGRDLAIAAGLALSLSTITGAAVYDRASGGTIAAAIMAPFSGDTESQTIAEVPNVIVPADEPAPAKAAELNIAPDPLPAPQPAATEQQALVTGDIKPIATAKLEVADAAGVANSPVDLDLRAVPGQAGQDLELRVSGVPEDAYLTAGTRISPASWSLKPAEAAIVKLVMPAQKSGEFDLAVAAVEAKTGELVAPMQEISVTVESATPGEQAAEPPAPDAPKKDTEKVLAEETVPAPTTPVVEQLPAESVEQPAAVPPPQATAALNPVPAAVAEPKAIVPETLPAAVDTPAAGASGADNDQARTLISRGDHLMSLGDLAAAREFYIEALKLGAAPTTLLQVGMTYDPVVYAANKVAGLSPDRQMALQYYQKADQAGVTAARDAIARLEAWPQN